MVRKGLSDYLRSACFDVFGYRDSFCCFVHHRVESLLKLGHPRRIKLANDFLCVTDKQSDIRDRHALLEKITNKRVPKTMWSRFLLPWFAEVPNFVELSAPLISDAIHTDIFCVTAENQRTELLSAVADSILHPIREKNANPFVVLHRPNFTGTIRL